MKVGIVVPFSWSFWGAVNEHAELQAEALGELGIETRTIIGNDPPGTFTRALHPRHGRHGEPPDDVIPVGRSVIVPANGSLPNIVLTTRVLPRVRQALAREHFDVLHLHEPMTPGICVSALAAARCPVVATWHASGELNWYRAGLPLWGLLIDRIDYRIAVSEQARASVARWLPAAYEVIPNGVLVPPAADPVDREHSVVFIGRHDPRKGLPVLLRSWPEIHARTGARLRVVGADPLAVRLLLSRHRIPETGIDVLGFLTQEDLTAELLRAKVLAAPSVGMESFGMVLTRAFACAVPVVSSDIEGYRDVMTEDTGLLVPPGEPAALAEGVCTLLEDEPLRRRLGATARIAAVERYSWGSIAERLAEVYELVVARAGKRRVPA
ncbi:MAG TPA: glycosyltransferase family 4 protein [Gaiellaceae bacterium]|nr:glycosyltransferase family 4 protein [Gaiellaceae bacterium]